MLESDEDRLTSLELLGESATIDGKKLFGIFESIYLDALEDPGIASSEPEFLARTSDLNGVTQSSVIERENGEKYRVREIEPDGTGMTLLRLRNYG